MTQAQNFQRAMQAWTSILSPERVEDLRGAILPDIAEYKSRVTPARLQPTTSREVAAVVAVANQYKIPLYTFSVGKNWGLGSSKPVKDGCVLVDLGRMNQILEVDASLRYMVIEPGVNQQKVAECLVGTGMIASFGGGGTTISLVGNVLDRGTGLFGDRTSDILAMEVILGNGKIIRTGLWNYEDPTSQEPFPHSYAPGLGPDLKGLFVQSNLGIVTKMSLRLVPFMHRTIFKIAYTSRCDSLISALVTLKETGVIDRGLRFSPQLDKNLYYPGMSASCWECIGALSGTPLIRSAKKEAVQAAFHKQDKATIVFADTEFNKPVNRSLEWWKDYIEKYNGNVSNNHLENFYKMGEGDKTSDASQKNYALDENTSVPGFVVLNMVVPAKAKMIENMITTVREISEDFDLSPTLGFGDLHYHAFKGHVGISFNRGETESIQKVHAWKKALYQSLCRLKIYPQRLDIDSMQDFCQVDQSDYWKTVASIKKATDPNNILSPGRYLW